MKFHLKTLFAITAGAGLWLLLARLNPWLPLLLTVLLGPVMGAFLWRPTQILTATVVTLIIIIGATAAPTFTTTAHFGDVGLIASQGSAVIHKSGLALVFTLPGQDPLPDAFPFKVEWDIGIASMGSNAPSTLLHLSLQLLLIVPIACGLMLHLLARWLEQRKPVA